MLLVRSLDSTVSSFVLLLSTTWSRETSHQLFDSYILVWNSSVWSSQDKMFHISGLAGGVITISDDLVATCKTEGYHRSKCTMCSTINDVDEMSPVYLKIYKCAHRKSMCKQLLLGLGTYTRTRVIWGISWSRYSCAYNGLSGQGIHWVYTFLERRVVVRQDAYKVIRRKDYRIDSSHKKNLEWHSQ